MLDSKTPLKISLLFIPRSLSLPTEEMNEPAQSLQRSNHHYHYHNHHHHPHNNNRSGRTNLASCAVATVFLLAIAAAAVAVYIFIFKPKPPLIAVNAVQFPAFSISNGTVNFEFLQYVTIRNLNRDEFSHYDSSLQVVYSGQPVGTVFIPAGRIGGGGTQKMSAKFDLQQYPLPQQQQQKVALDRTEIIETHMELVGRVRVLKVFMHRVETQVKCGVAIETTRGTVLGLRC